MLDQLKEFARGRAASHPGLFHPQTFPSDLFHEMGKMGLLGALDLGAVARGSHVIAAETGSLGFAIAWAGQSLVPLVLDRCAGLPEEMKAGVASGDTIIALAVSEPNAGAHPKLLTATAARVPGGWRLDGLKAVVTNGPIASHVAVLAITGAEGSRKAFSFFLVPVGAPGLTPIEQPQFDFLRPAQHCGFRLENCQVPENALIGRPGQGYPDIALPFRGLEDAVLASALIGVLGRAARLTALSLGPDCTYEAALAFGELAGLETALEALNAPVLAALEAWDTETERFGLHLIAIHDLAWRCAEILQAISSMMTNMSAASCGMSRKPWTSPAPLARQRKRGLANPILFLVMISLENTKYECSYR